VRIKVQEYLRADGSNPYKGWFDSLDAQAAAKIVTAKLRLELGNASSVKWFGGIGEYVIDWGPGYRIYLARDGAAFIVLFGGGTKRGQQKGYRPGQSVARRIQGTEENPGHRKKVKR
jgi:putative addiction module killer protein